MTSWRMTGRAMGSIFCFRHADELQYVTLRGFAEQCLPEEFRDSAQRTVFARMENGLLITRTKQESGEIGTATSFPELAWKMADLDDGGRTAEVAG